jgi:pimeloyl-ACP methyl ester carboxylesterase
VVACGEHAADALGDRDLRSRPQRSSALQLSSVLAISSLVSSRQEEEGEPVASDWLGGGPVRALVGLLVLATLLAGATMMWSRWIDRVIFHPTRGVALRPSDVGISGEEIFLNTEDGLRIHAFWLPAPDSHRALLFLHGNAGNASHRLPNAAELVALDTSVLLLDYRGYGLSEGSPSEAGVYADARAGLEWLQEEKKIPESRIVVFGRSLGGAVAVDLAQDSELGGVILESTFTSLSDMADSLLPFSAPLTRGRFDSRSKIRKLRSPLLFFHGNRDEIVPYTLGQKLFEEAPDPKAFETINGAGHNDTTLVGGRRYFARIGEFLDTVVPRPKP